METDILEIRGSVGFITIDHPPVNSLSQEIYQELEATFQQATDDPAIVAIVFIGANDTFSAGFDLSTIENDLPSEGELREGNLRIHRFKESIEDSAKPVVAAITGVALGGGLELAMACHFRIATSASKLGLPEVQVGLIPGGGGTQRLPRLIGPIEAIKMICGGSQVSADKALKLGLVDQVVPEDQLVEVSEGFALEQASGGPWPKTRERKDNLPGWIKSAFLFPVAKRKVREKAGIYTAPMKAFQCIETGVRKGYQEGIEQERRDFGAAFFGEQSKGLVHLFFASRKAVQISELEDATTKSIETVGIVGGGTMGRDIAFVNLLSRKNVVLVEADQQRLDAAMEVIRGHCQRRIDRGRMTPERMQLALDQIRPTLDYGDLSEVDLIIEAVVDDEGVKKRVLARINQVVSSDTIITSNTSTISIARLAEAVEHPQRVMGLHFFSPVRVMPLLEEIRTGATSPETARTCLEYAKAIKKTPILVGDCQGFLTNRLAMASGAEANALLQEGASLQQVDRVCVEFGLPMGPVQMGDMAGVDIWYRAMPGMQTAYPDRCRSLSPLAKAMFDAGRHGQKVGKGYYRYEPGGRDPLPDPEFDELVAVAQRELGITPRSEISDEEVLERLLYTWVNAAAFCLEEGVVLRSSDVDIASVLGFGFPAWRGGLMYWAAEVGYKNIADRLDCLAETISPVFKPAGWLRD